MSLISNWFLVLACSKQEFVDVDGLVIECNLQNENTEIKSCDKNEQTKNDNFNKEEKKTVLDLADEKHDSSKSSVEIKPSSWASLFKNGSSLNENTNNNNKNNKNKQIAEIFSVQMEEVAIKNNVGSQAKNNPLSLIDIEKDERAITLGGKTWKYLMCQTSKSVMSLVKLLIK